MAGYNFPRTKRRRHAQKHDLNGDSFLDLQEVKRMLEVLQVTLTHIETKSMITEVDKDGDG